MAARNATTKTAQRPLTTKQRVFVEVYAGNAAEAAIRAGYGGKNARDTGLKILKSATVREAIKERLNIRNNKTLDNLTRKSTPKKMTTIKKGNENNETKKKSKESDYEKVKKMSRCGLPQEKIADIMGVCVNTLVKRFRAALDEGALEATSEVSNMLYESCRQKNVAAQIFWMKSRGGWKETQQIDQNVTQTPQVVIELPDNGRD